MQREKRKGIELNTKTQKRNNKTYSAIFYLMQVVVCLHFMLTVQKTPPDANNFSPSSLVMPESGLARMRGGPDSQSGEGIRKSAYKEERAILFFIFVLFPNE